MYPLAGITERLISSSHLRMRSHREREAWRLAILLRGFVWTQRSSFAGEGIGALGMERLR
jgi:hypothetical protein